MKMQIRNRWTGACLWEGEAEYPEELSEPGDLLDNYGSDIAEVMLGVRLPGAFGFRDDDGDHWFDTWEEAQAALAVAMASGEAEDANE